MGHVTRRDTRRRAATAAAALVVGVLAACASGGAIERLGPTEPCAARGDEKVAKALVRCSQRSVVYVETVEASGTGVVLSLDGKHYVLTNSHVVDPWGAADITVDGRKHTEVDLVGVDAGADIAVLGPLPDSAELDALEIADGARPERGDDVFLVGYPGEAPPDDPEDLEATIAGGIVSRMREVKAFDQTYVQTDASIAGGQSGGPLFDAGGQLVGISGLSFADEFALALSAADVAEAVERIMSGDGDDHYPDLPVAERDDMVREGQITLHDASDTQALYLPPADDDRTLEFTIDVGGDLLVTMSSPDADGLLAISANYDDVQARLQELIAASSAFVGEDSWYSDDSFFEPGFDPGFDPGVDELDEDDPARAEISPGVFSVEVPADARVFISVEGPLLNSPLSVPFTSSLPLWPVTAERTEEPLAVGESVDRVIGTFESGSDFLVDLDEGQRVEIRAESAQSDVAMTIFSPGVTIEPVVLSDPSSWDGVEEVDDSGAGLYGFDAVTVVEAETAGTYRVRMYANDFMTVLGRLVVTDCDATDCDKEGGR